MTKQRSFGFNLIELMIVVAIIAVLAAIAYPAYGRYAFRARRADGQEMLMRLAAAQERYYTNFNKYASSIGSSGLGFASDVSENGFYKITAATGTDAQTFTLTATPQGIQADDACGKLELTSTGGRSAPDDTGVNGKCW